MRKQLWLAIVVIALVSLSIGARAQESLGDVARRYRVDKQNAAAPNTSGAQTSTRVGEGQSEAGPVTEIQLFAWLAGGLSNEDVIQEVHTRGIAFEPDASCLKNLVTARDDASLARVLDEFRRHDVTAPEEQKPEIVRHAVEAAIAAKRKDYAAALIHLRTALQVDLNNGDLYFAAGYSFGQLEHWGPAALALTRAIELNPGFPYGHGLLSLAFYNMQDGDRAEAEARIMLKSLPNNSDAHKFLGLAFSAQEDYNGALAEYAEALRLNPKNALVYYDIGVVRAAQSDWERAIDAYQQAIKTAQVDWYVYNNLGIALGRVNRVQEAISAFEKGRARAPNRPDLLQSYGALLCNHGYNAQAVEVFTHLLATTSDWNMARPCLYRSLMKLGRTAEAEQVKQDYIKYSPDHTAW
jgi:tetratricopeptide (TPR) repeat protein